MVSFGVLFIRVPYYIGDLKGDPNLENYPYLLLLISSRMQTHLQSGCLHIMSKIVILVVLHACIQTYIHKPIHSAHRILTIETLHTIHTVRTLHTMHTIHAI